MGRYNHMLALDDKGKVHTWGYRSAVAGKPIKVLFKLRTVLETIATLKISESIS